MHLRLVFQPLVCAGLLGALAASGCAGATPEQEAFVRLDADEAALLDSHPVPGDRRDQQATIDDTVARLGLDPFRVLALPGDVAEGAAGYLVLLRNQSEVVRLDNQLTVVARASTPRSPTGWDLIDDRYLFVSGELSNLIHVFDVGAADLRLQATISLDNVGSVRDLEVVDSDLFALDNFDNRLLRLALPRKWREAEGGMVVGRTDFDIGPGSLSVDHVGDFLLINEMLAHSLAMVPLHEGTPEFDGAARIQHDGPMWAVDVVRQGDTLLLALGGVENRPLDRTGGDFGYVDSFVYLYRVPVSGESGSPHAGAARLVDSVNVSELGVVTPKSVRFDISGRLWVSGFGGERLAVFEVGDGEAGLSVVQTRTSPPGITDFVVDGERLIGVSTLLDRVVVSAGEDWNDWRYAPLVFDDAPDLGEPHNEHAVDVRVGETLFFSTLFSPDNRTEGELSRFTCETCHFEGTFDGRTHFTGRDDVYATTKTLRGLANNVPLFTRAGDPTMSTMIMGEFRVANQERRAFFDVEVTAHPWLTEFGVRSTLTPDDQRLAFLSFLVDYTHPPNPWTAQGRPLDRQATAGLEVFRERCAVCHQAATSTRESGDSVPFDRWQEWLETESWDPVWASALYTKTGIEPYVAEAGARVPSLRRVKQKYPYFTNGSSTTLRSVLERFRYRGAQGWHDPAGVQGGGGDALDADEIAVLLRLLEFF